MKAKLCLQTVKFGGLWLAGGQISWYSDYIFPSRWEAVGVLNPNRQDTLVWFYRSQDTRPFRINAPGNASTILNLTVSFYDLADAFAFFLLYLAIFAKSTGATLTKILYI